MTCTQYVIPFLALILLIPAGMSNVTAQEYTDEEILEEYNRLFGNSTIQEGDAIGSDANIVTYAPLGEITDEIKIDSLRSVEEAKLNIEEYDKFVKKQVKDRKPLLGTVSEILKMIDETDDPQHKAMLQNALNDLKPLMAEHGIFLEEDKQNRELVDLWIEKSEVKQDPFDPLQKMYHMIQLIIQWFQTLVTPMQDKHVKNIKPFSDYPTDIYDEIRLTLEVEKFYNMYEEYDILAMHYLESPPTTVWYYASFSDRYVHLLVDFSDVLYKFKYTCYIEEPRKLLFVEDTVTTKCF